MDRSEAPRERRLSSSKTSPRWKRIDAAGRLTSGVSQFPVDAVRLGVVVVVRSFWRVDLDREAAAGDRGDRLASGPGDGEVDVACGHEVAFGGCLEKKNAPARLNRAGAMSKKGRRSCSLESGRCVSRDQFGHQRLQPAGVGSAMRLRPTTHGCGSDTVHASDRRPAGDRRSSDRGRPARRDWPVRSIAIRARTCSASRHTGTSRCRPQRRTIRGGLL